MWAVVSFGRILNTVYEDLLDKDQEVGDSFFAIPDLLMDWSI